MEINEIIKCNIDKTIIFLDSLITPKFIDIID